MVPDDVPYTTETTWLRGRPSGGCNRAKGDMMSGSCSTPFDHCPAPYFERNGVTLYLGDAVRIIGHHPGAGEILARADPDQTRDLAIGQEVVFGFAPKDAVAVGGER